MFEHQGIWLPDGERHFQDWMNKNGEIVDGRGTYQIKKLREAMKHVRRFRCALDVGAHVGLWTMQLARLFDVVHAFEPVQDFRDCFARNVPAANVFLYPVALGASIGNVVMETPTLDGGLDTGGTHVAHGAGDTEMRALDELEFEDVDFVKIDCEGYEHHVLEGARSLIRRCRPTVIVEQKPRKLRENFGIVGAPAVAMLRATGYEVARELSGDYIMVPKD